MKISPNNFEIRLKMCSNDGEKSCHLIKELSTDSTYPK